MNSGRKIIVSSLSAFLLMPCLAQHPELATSAAAGKTHEGIPTIYLKVASTIPVPGISESLLTTALCGSDHSVVLRVAGLAGIGDLVSISSDGQQVVRFSAFKVRDIDNPKFYQYFIGGSDVYVLTRSSKPTDETMKLRTPNGDIITQRKFSTKDYIVQFQRDGTFLRSVALDVPFTPQQIGAFPSGGFLVAGAAKDGSFRPVVALVKSDGQLDRYLELKGDIRAAQAGKKEDAKDPVALPRWSTHGTENKQSLTVAENLSLVVADGRNLLLLRSGQKTPIFSVSPGGEVRAIVPDVPPGFTLYDLRAGQNIWVALYTHPHSDDPKDASVNIETYALDPVSGKAIARYVYPGFIGLGLACSDGLDFTVLERPGDKLELVKLVPVQAYSSEKTK
jgi:hypothetical protein